MEPGMRDDLIILAAVCKEFNRTPSYYLFPHVHCRHSQYAVDREVFLKLKDFEAEMADDAKRSIGVLNQQSEEKPEDAMVNYDGR